MKLWIARQKSGRLIICDKEMKLCHDMYYDGGFLSETMKLPNDAFPEVTFENSPQEVELKLIK